MNNIDPTRIDFVAIEDEARALRAEAIRYGTSQAAAWVKATFQRLFAGKTQTA